MNKQLKQKWIDALTSGKYTQSDLCLRRNEGHCCLGVLADIVDPTKWVSVRQYNFDGVMEGSYPTDEWLNKIGLSIDMARHLAHRNDDGDSFSVIAKYISEYVPEDD